MKSIRVVLLALLIVGLGASLALGAVAWYSGQQMLAQARMVFTAKDVTADILPPPLYLIEARLTLSQALDGTLSPDEAAKTFDKLEADYTQRAQFWRDNQPYGLERFLLGEQDAAARQFLAAARRDIIEPLKKDKAEVARAAMPAVHALYLAHRAGVDKTVEAANAFAERNDAEFQVLEASSRQWNLGVLSVGMLACIALYIGARRRIQKSVVLPLLHASEVADRISKGDLSGEVSVQGQDDVAAMLAAMASMKESLRTVVAQVRDSSDSIATGSAQIASGNVDLSQRTEQQAANLEQTAAAMEQLRAAVKSNAATARQAKDMAQSASAAATQGGDVVKRVATTMEQINQSAQRIADIVGVIDGIAFQTNLLALNAAVEAARAGSNGRGFAVVASEVRGLAQRCASAAKEIQVLIGESVQRVEAGNNLVIDAGKAMHDIVERAALVDAFIGEISVASGEQSTGIEEVGNAVCQLDRVTQQNAALVEESASAADNLNRHAVQLSSLVGTFNLGGEALAARSTRDVEHAMAY